MTTVWEELEGAAAVWARRFTAGELEARPRRRVAVVTCMDARLDPVRVLGIELGDAHVIRNAGARVTPDVLRSLALSTGALGVRSIALIQHTACGVAADEHELRAAVESQGGRLHGDVELYAMPDPDAALREDLDRVRSSALLPPDVDVRAYVYDVATGQLRPGPP